MPLPVRKICVSGVSVSVFGFVSDKFKRIQIPRRLFVVKLKMVSEFTCHWAIIAFPLIDKVHKF